MAINKTSRRNGDARHLKWNKIEADKLISVRCSLLNAKTFPNDSKIKTIASRSQFLSWLVYTVKLMV